MFNRFVGALVPGPGLAFFSGFEGPGGPRGHWSRRSRMGRGFPGHWGSFGPRARRGDVRAAILALLSEQPMHGYQIIQELEARSGGAWRVSPGSIYPTLQLLEDEGLVAAQEVDGKRVYSLTESGRAQADTNRASGEVPWEEVAGAAEEPMRRLRDAAFQLGAAAFQVAHAGSGEQVNRTIDVLAEARRQIYAILAEGK